MREKYSQPFTHSWFAGIYGLHVLMTALHECLVTSRIPALHRFGFPLAVVTLAAFQSGRQATVTATITIAYLQAEYTNMMNAFETF